MLMICNQESKILTKDSIVPIFLSVRSSCGRVSLCLFYQVIRTNSPSMLAVTQGYAMHTAVPPK